MPSSRIRPPVTVCRGTSPSQDLGGIFHFTTLSPEEVTYAFTYWFQNVLNMPISLLDANIKAICHQYNFSPEELITAEL
jgi:hypothetical protein